MGIHGGRHGRATRYRPELVPELMADVADLRLVLAHRHPEPTRRHLIQCLAQLSGLMALTLLKLGDPAARDWWPTSRAAAATSEDRTTLAWMYAQETYQLYYTGNLHGAVELAARAQHYAGGLPCVGSALAAPLGARALAQLGRREETKTTLEAAEAGHAVTASITYGIDTAAHSGTQRQLLRGGVSLSRSRRTSKGTGRCSEFRKMPAGA
ncbi:LOG family protein [Actinacidiphila glaucinigra]|uniref:Uncharacterized protein n=1 Tax=Actinacidiphila glaucinigra TaxID=235986 RepID=A0A239LVZ5_9ACTN|nr:hypothetical protein [Actinacidiphila glaucinigra]SNT34545.1 hypothetical protein SAMN05216252_121131 [Actinacidiphila glaucinigra]